MLTLCLLSALAAPPTFAPALVAQTEDATPTMEDAGGLMATMVQSFKDKNWPLAFGSLALLLALIVGAINGFLFKFTVVSDETRKAALPWLAAAGGCLSAFGLALIGGLGWLNALVAGLVTSAAAAGLWELIGKQIKKATAKPGT